MEFTVRVTNLDIYNTFFPIPLQRCTCNFISVSYAVCASSSLLFVLRVKVCMLECIMLAIRNDKLVSQKMENKSTVE